MSVIDTLRIVKETRFNNRVVYVIEKYVIGDWFQVTTRDTIESARLVIQMLSVKDIISREVVE